MQIVIELSEEIYKNIIATWEQIHPQVHNALKNGIPLPKGHGKLIDSTVLWDAYQDLGQDFYEAFDFAETNAIIEADKEVDL